jgi:hypothetical protein
MDLDKVYKLGKTIAIFALSCLLISATIKVWCGNCCEKLGNRKACAVSPCNPDDVKVIMWDSDSGEFDIDAILDSEGLSSEMKEMVTKIIEEVEIEVDGDKEVRKKVMVKVIGE